MLITEDINNPTHVRIILLGASATSGAATPATATAAAPPVVSGGLHKGTEQVVFMNFLLDLVADNIEQS